MKVPKISDLKQEEYTPLIEGLLTVVHYQSDFIQSLKNEIAVLKGDKKLPTVRPGNLGTNGGGSRGNGKENLKGTMILLSKN
ncbi:MAG: hypothetical protein HQK53_00895 [Oligoflexia bacterium]|nr:hypothetical protein [Oligoflexia bacterium]